jgi:hypothetical protein
MVENARDVGDDSVAKRQTEFELIRENFSTSPAFAKIEAISELFAEFQSHGVLPSDSAERAAFAGEFQHILRDPRNTITPSHS